MFNIKNILLLLCCLIVTPVLATNWIQVETAVDKISSFYVDTSSIKRDGQIARTYTKAVLGTGITVAFHRTDNCQSGEIRLTDKNVYNSSGKLVEKDSPMEVVVLTKPSSGSADATLQTYICTTAGISAPVKTSDIAQGYQGQDFWGKPSYEKRLYALGQKLLSVNGISENMAFQIAHNQDELNAFSVAASNDITVTGGLIRMMENDDEMAAVLAHEIAHIVLRHTEDKERHMKAYAQQLQAQLDTHRRRQVTSTAILSGLVGGASGYGAIPAALEAGARENNRQLVLNQYYSELYKAEYRRTYLAAYNQTLELEADREAFAYMVKAGYNPHAFISVFRKISGDGSAKWATHPTSSVRIEQIQKLISQKSAI